MRALFLALLLCALGGCDRAAPSSPSIVLATTTSLQDTGLLDELIPAFQRATGIDVKPIAVGTGEAIAMARRGEADVVFAHSPEDEESLIADGVARERRPIMRNFFQVVGPPDDPAGAARAPSAADALRAIAAAKAPFVTRGDRSGTHKRELLLWKKAGVDPAAAPWYVRASAGMAETLRIADERRAYALTDEGTFLAERARLALTALFARRDADLANVYSVLVLDGERLPTIDAARGRAFADFVAGPEGRAAIARFGEARFGRPLFQLEAAR